MPDHFTRALGPYATVQEIVDAESDKLCSIDPEYLGTDAAAIVKALSAVTGTLAAVALAVDRVASRKKGQDR
jgi:hypothetical protein